MQHMSMRLNWPVSRYLHACSVCTFDGFAAGLSDSFAGGRVLGVYPKVGVYTLLGIRGVLVLWCQCLCLRAYVGC